MPRSYRDRRYQDRIAYEAFLQYQRRRKNAAVSKKLIEMLKFMEGEFAHFNDGRIRKSLLWAIKDLKAGNFIEPSRVYRLYDDAKRNKRFRFEDKQDKILAFYEALIKVTERRERLIKKWARLNGNLYFYIPKLQDEDKAADKNAVQEFRIARRALGNIMSVKIMHEGDMPKLKEVRIVQSYLRKRAKANTLFPRAQKDVMKYLKFLKRYLTARKKLKLVRGKLEPLILQMSRAFK